MMIFVENSFTSSIFVSVINTLTVSCHYNVLLIQGNVQDNKFMKVKNFGIRV